MRLQLGCGGIGTMKEINAPCGDRKRSVAWRKGPEVSCNRPDGRGRLDAPQSCVLLAGECTQHRRGLCTGAAGACLAGGPIVATVDGVVCVVVGTFGARCARSHYGDGCVRDDGEGRDRCQQIDRHTHVANGIEGIATDGGVC